MTRSKRRKINESTLVETSNNEIISNNEMSPVDHTVASTTVLSNPAITPLFDVESVSSSDQSLNVEMEEPKSSPNQNIESTSHASPPNMAINTIPFKVGEIIWGKIWGWPHWPAKIVRFWRRQFEVIWYNDFRVTKLYRSQMYKFSPNFHIFAEKFDTTVGLREAAEQAMLEIMKRRPLKLNDDH